MRHPAVALLVNLSARTVRLRDRPECSAHFHEYAEVDWPRAAACLVTNPDRLPCSAEEFGALAKLAATRAGMGASRAHCHKRSG